MSTATEAPPSIPTPPKPRRMRPVFWVLLVAAVIYGAVVLILHTNATAVNLPDSAPKEPTAAQVTAVNTLLSELGVPTGAHRDPYDTACGIPTGYCVSSAKATPKQLLDGVLTEFRAHGASITSHGCVSPEQRDDTLGVLGLCQARLRYQGATLTVETNDVSPLGRVKNPAWLFVLPLSASDVSGSDGPTKPLGSWDSLHLLPAGWVGEATCTVGTANACTGYKLTMTRPGNAIELMTPWKAAIMAAGYRIDTLRCFTPSAPDASCHLAAMRFQTLGGKNLLILTASTRQTSASQTTVTLLMGDQPHPKLSPAVALPPAKS